MQQDKRQNSELSCSLLVSERCCDSRQQLVSQRKMCRGMRIEFWNVTMCFVGTNTTAPLDNSQHGPSFLPNEIVDA
jgi:hypothetical protein